MRDKILIIGSKGMAGHVIYNYFKSLKNYEVVDISRNHDFFKSNYAIDVANFSQVEEILVKEQPVVVINCIGILNKDAEDNPDKAILFNSYFPHFLARIGLDNNFKLIHISTDCVFNGQKGCYIENDFKDGIGFYAQSKALGEVTYNDHLTIRTSIIGPELKDSGIGLFHWFMSQNGSVNGYTNAIWGGVTTFELAKSINAFILQKMTGLIHLTNGVKISKFELLSLIKEVFNTENKTIVSYQGKNVDKSLLSSRTDFNYSVPDYRQMIVELKSMMHKYDLTYNHNYHIFE